MQPFVITVPARRGAEESLRHLSRRRTGGGGACMQCRGGGARCCASLIVYRVIARFDAFSVT